MLYYIYWSRHSRPNIAHQILNSFRSLLRKDHIWRSFTSIMSNRYICRLDGLVMPHTPTFMWVGYTTYTHLYVVPAQRKFHQSGHAAHLHHARKKANHSTHRGSLRANTHTLPSAIFSFLWCLAVSLPPIPKYIFYEECSYCCVAMV